MKGEEQRIGKASDLTQSAKRREGGINANDYAYLGFLTCPLTGDPALAISNVAGWRLRPPVMARVRARYQEK